MQRTLTDTEMEAVLASETFGHLGCSDSNGKPYVFPLAFAYHAGVLYGQTMEGAKIEIVRRNPLVCFQVQQQGDIEWRSVMCWGMYEEMDFGKIDEREAVGIVELLTAHLGDIQKTVGVVIPQYSFGDKEAVPFIVNGKKSTLFRIVITEKTGRLYVAKE